MKLPIKVQGVVHSIQDGEVSYLLIKRNSKDGGFWQSVTGTVNDGECLVDGLSRELEEEIGVRPTGIEHTSNIEQIIQWPKRMVLL